MRAGWRQLLVAVLATVLVPVVFAGPASGAGRAAGSDVRGPSCADIVRGTADQQGTTLSAIVDVGARSCRGIRYTLVVSDLTGAPVARAARAGDRRSSRITLTVSVPADRTLCFDVTTSGGRGHHVFDRVLLDVHDPQPSSICCTPALYLDNTGTAVCGRTYR